MKVEGRSEGAEVWKEQHWSSGWAGAWAGRGKAPWSQTGSLEQGREAEAEPRCVTPFHLPVLSAMNLNCDNFDCILSPFFSLIFYQKLS